MLKKTRSTRRLSIALLTTTTLACDPQAPAGQDGPSDMAQADMPREDQGLADMAPDQGADQAGDAQVTLKRVWTQDPRTINALAPKALTLRLDVDGELPQGAMVQVRFARGELGQLELPAKQTLMVSPPASTSVRGPVSLSVRYGEQEVELEGGLLYGLDVTDHPLLRDGAQASRCLASTAQTRSTPSTRTASWSSNAVVSPRPARLAIAAKRTTSM